MTWNRITSLTVLVLIAAAGFTTRHTAQNRKESAGAERASVGLVSETRHPLPDYRMVDVDMREVPSDALRHGRVLLVYLTTGCDPCVQEAGVISRLQRDAPSDFRIFGIGIERPAQLATFVREFDLKFPVLVDVGSQLARSMEIHHFPSKYLVEDGVITKEWRGKTKDEADLRRQLGLQ